MTTEPTPPAPPPPTPPPAPPSSGDPWHKGLDAELLGHIQNTGWDKLDPGKAAIEAAKAHREAAKFIGVPADQILKMPKADAKPEEIKAFWSRLGAGEAKDYDLSGVKMNGQPLDEALSAAIRDSLAASFVPKDKGSAIAAGVAKALEAAENARTTVATAKLAEEKTTLAKNWSDKYDYNLLKAMEGARRLGITPEAVKALENQIGYASIMETMRKIGAGTSEDTFIERGPGGTGQPTTVEGAKARLSELEGDREFGKRLKARDATAVAEWTSLTQLIGNQAA
jgi:hypothetical protein